MTNPIAIKVGADATGPLLEVSVEELVAADVAAAIAAKSSETPPGDLVPVWVDHPEKADGNLDEAMSSVGYRARRDLWKLEVGLPPIGGFAAAEGVAVRSFVINADEEAWVEVNNRAFAWHREQGGWTVEQVAEREAEDWFDADGFLIHELDGDIAGFCWTKIHDEEEPPAGEIYVIGVDPAHHGKGLGRAMTVAGLESIHSRGFSRAILYVDADNTPAARLYETLGFTVETVRRLYS
ncbi:MAG: mycothiol synthase [Actinomycetia bacterium]|nr:mycothiol synthase [Actinomycetes bacterium]